MSAYQEFTGKSVEDALKAARETFGVGLNDLDFEILTPGSRGVLGMGAEPARIVAAPRDALGGNAPKRDAAAATPLPAPAREERPRDDRGPRPDDRGPRRDDRPQAAPQAALQAAPRTDAPAQNAPSSVPAVADASPTQAPAQRRTATGRSTPFGPAARPIVRLATTVIVGHADRPRPT